MLHPIELNITTQKYQLSKPINPPRVHPLPQENRPRENNVKCFTYLDKTDYNFFAWI